MISFKGNLKALTRELSCNRRTRYAYQIRNQRSTHRCAMKTKTARAPSLATTPYAAQASSRSLSFPTRTLDTFSVLTRQPLLAPPCRASSLLMDFHLERLVKRLEEAEDDAHAAKKAYEKATDNKLSQAEIDRLKLRKGEAEKNIAQAKVEVMQAKHEGYLLLKSNTAPQDWTEAQQALLDAAEEALKDAKSPTQ